MKRASDGRPVLRFTKGYRSYSTGVVAAFPEKEAERLVKVAKVAVYDGEKTKPADPPSGQSKNENDPNTGYEDTFSLFLDEAGEDWKKANGNTMIALAKTITTDPVMNKIDAIAAIELEIELRAEAGQ